MSQQDLILVVGASGTVGSQLVKELKAKGLKVRSTTSKKVSNSNELVHLDLTTGEGLSQAFQGVSKAFLLSPPNHPDQYKILSPLIQEAKKAKLKKVVLMTAMGANAVESTPFRRAEIELEKSGLNYNILRPNWFLQNFNTFWVHGILNAGKIELPAGTAKVSFIDARDIARSAAVLLSSDSFSKQAFDLSGPAAVDHSQVATEISSCIKKPVSYTDIKPEVLKERLLSFQLNPAYVDFMLMIFGFLREGYNARTTDSVEKITGKKPLSLADYVRDYQTSWKS